jgi:excisionase family DNA binding protein
MATDPHHTKKSNFLPEKPLWVSVKTARHLTGLGLTKIYRLIADGTLESFKLGDTRLISFASIEHLPIAAKSTTPNKNVDLAIAARRAKHEATRRATTESFTAAPQAPSRKSQP